MAISTYADLKSAVASWLVRTDLTSDIPDFIQLAERRIEHTIRVPEMETTLSISATTSASVITLSASTLAIKYIHISGQLGSLLNPPVTPETFECEYSDSGASTYPVWWTKEGPNLRIAPVPTASVTLVVRTYRRLASFSADADTNLLLQRAPGLYLYGALLESAPFLGQDNRVAVWTSYWEDQVQRLNEQKMLDHVGNLRPYFV